MQRKLIIEAFGQPELLMIAAQMLMFIPSAPLAQNPLLAAVIFSQENIEVQLHRLHILIQYFFYKRCKYSRHCIL